MQCNIYIQIVFLFPFFFFKKEKIECHPKSSMMAGCDGGMWQHLQPMGKNTGSNRNGTSQIVRG